MNAGDYSFGLGGRLFEFFQPKEHKTHRDFDVQEREFVFDLDLTDYDDVRSCCQFGQLFFLNRTFLKVSLLKREISFKVENAAFSMKEISIKSNFYFKKV